MDQKWASMTYQEKRQYKIEKYLKAEGIRFVNPEAKKSYKKRAQRLVDAYNISKPDRVPVNIPLGNLPLKLFGLNKYDTMYNYGFAVKACNKFNEEYSNDLEVFATPTIMPGKALEILDYRLYVWPGHGLPLDAAGFQYVEGEYMLENEYDDLIRDPSNFWSRTYLPRVFGTLAPLNTSRPLTDITEIIGAQQLSLLSVPDIQDMLQKMLEAGREYGKAKEAMHETTGQAAAHGFPTINGIFCKAPFDVIGDTLRGTRGIIADIYRRPDKLLKALDVIAETTIASVLSTPGIRDTLFVSYPLHKGADGWMSQKQFETFYWPTLRKVMNAFIREGLMQHLFAEGSYNTRLDNVNEFPKGFVSWLFDQTDMAQAKKVLGDKCCIEGNIPSSLLVTGSPADVKEYCRELIELCGANGGYILAAGATPENPRIENLKAIIEAAREFGTYN